MTGREREDAKMAAAGVPEHARPAIRQGMLNQLNRIGGRPSDALAMEVRAYLAGYPLAGEVANAMLADAES